MTGSGAVRWTAPALPSLASAGTQEDSRGWDAGLESDRKTLTSRDSIRFFLRAPGFSQVIKGEGEGPSQVPSLHVISVNT